MERPGLKINYRNHMRKEGVEMNFQIAVTKETEQELKLL
jgi:hypothetical protein